MSVVLGVFGILTGAVTILLPVEARYFLLRVKGVSMRALTMLVLCFAASLVMAGCGQTPPPLAPTATPTLDVEATVQAMVEDRLATEPTPTQTSTPDVEASVQAMVEARLTTEPTPTTPTEATATPTPTSTPTTPTEATATPTPTSTPTTPTEATATPTPTSTPTTLHRSNGNTHADLDAYDSHRRQRPRRPRRLRLSTATARQPPHRRSRLHA